MILNGALNKKRKAAPGGAPLAGIGTAFELWSGTGTTRSTPPGYAQHWVVFSQEDADPSTGKFVTPLIRGGAPPGAGPAFALEGGKSLAVKLAEETSSVMMRGKTRGFAYAD